MRKGLDSCRHTSERADCRSGGRVHQRLQFPFNSVNCLKWLDSRITNEERESLQVKWELPYTGGCRYAKDRQFHSFRFPAQLQSEMRTKWVVKHMHSVHHVCVSKRSHIMEQTKAKKSVIENHFVVHLNAASSSSSIPSSPLTTLFKNMKKLSMHT